MFAFWETDLKAINIKKSHQKYRLGTVSYLTLQRDLNQFNGNSASPSATDVVISAWASVQFD